MRRNPVDFQRDIPDDRKPKRIVFYANGLKIYGVLPFVLNRKLNGKFCSGLKGSGDEDNYTIVGYSQTPTRVQELADWLYGGAGVEWGIAETIERLTERPGASPMTYRPDKTALATTIAHYFGCAVQHPEVDAPQPTDAVLSVEPAAQLRSGDVVLGDIHQSP